jgi:hypothetical protein
MSAKDEGLPGTADAGPSAERRSSTDRRMAAMRRHADRRAIGLAPDMPAEPASRAPDSQSPSSAEPAVARKFHFRSFEDRRLGIERRTAPDADDERLTTDEAASLLRQEDC